MKKKKMQIFLFFILLYIVLSIAYFSFLKPGITKSYIQNVQNNYFQNSIHLSNLLNDQIRLALSELEKIANEKSFKTLNIKEINDNLKIHNHYSTLFNYFFLVDTQGNMLSYPSKPEMVGKTVMKENMDWVTNVVEQKQPYFNDVHRSQIGTFVSGISYPVFDINDNVIAILRGVIVVSSKNNALDVFQFQNQYEDIKKIIVDNNGRVIGGSSFIYENDVVFHEFDILDYEPVKNLIAHKTGVSISEFFGVKYVAAFNIVPINNWGVIVHAPLEDATKWISSISNLIFGVISIIYMIFLLSIFLIFRVSDSILDRVAISLNTKKMPSDSFIPVKSKIYSELKNILNSQKEESDKIKFYKFLLSSTNELIVATDFLGRIFYTNSGTDNPLHMTEEKMLGKYFNEVFNFTNEFTSEKLSFHELVQNSEYNSTYHIFCNYHKISCLLNTKTIDREAYRKGYLFIIQNNNEKAILKNQREQLIKYNKEIKDNLPFGIVIFEPVNNAEDFIIKEVNRTAEQVSKMNKSSLIGRSVFSIIEDVLETGLFQAMQRAYNTGDKVYCPVSRYEDGHLYSWYENIVFRMEDHSIVLIFENITDYIFEEKEREEIENEIFYINNILETMFNSIPDLIGVFDNEYNIIKINKAFKNYIDTSENVKKCYNLLCFEDKCCDFTNDYLNPENYSSEIFDPKRNLWFERRIYPVLDNDNKLMRIIGHLRDITERKNFEIQLTESENKYKTVTSLMSDYVYQVEFDQESQKHKLMWTAGAFEEITGYTIDEINQMPKGWLSVIEPGQEIEEVKYNEKGMYPGKIVSKIYKITRKDNTTVWLEDFIKPTFNENGQLLNILGAVKNITESIYAQENITHLNALLKAIRNVNKLITSRLSRIELITEVGKILSVIEGYNTTYIALFVPIDIKLEDNPRIDITHFFSDGFQFEFDLEIFKKKVYERSIGKCLRDCVSTRGIVIRSEPSEECDDCPIRKRYLKSNTVTAPLLYDNFIYGVVSVSIAENATINKEEGKLIEEVAKDIALSIHELEVSEKHEKTKIEKNRFEAQLRQWQKMETLGTLAGGIAHDFNNILTPIMGFTELSMSKLEKNTKPYNNLKQVLKNAQRAQELVSQILSFAREKEHLKKPVEIGIILKEALKFFRATIPSSITLNIDIEDNIGKVLGDATQIHQVILNLLTNAYQAIQDSYGIVSVSLNTVTFDEPYNIGRTELKPETYIRMIVEDNGVGMDAEMLERIYEPFYTTKKDQEGTGLGLSVVMGIIISHQGNIQVKSTINEGSTFIVYLPKFDSSDNFEEIEISSSPKHGSETILIVDDEEDITKMTSQFLSKLGYKTLTAKDSTRALTEFENNPHNFDLIITDQTMPKLTGMELAEKALIIRPDIPIILITGFSEVANYETVTKLGIIDFFHKPIDLQKLALRIREALDEGVSNNSTVS